MNRIEAINAYASKALKEREAKRMNEMDKIKELENEILLLEPRIRELIETKNACENGGIDISFYKFSEHDDEPIGFYLNSIKLIKFPYEIETDGKQIRYYEFEKGSAKIHGEKVAALLSFLKHYDNFEKRFYGYVDRILKKGGYL